MGRHADARVASGIGKFGCRHQWVSMGKHFVCANKGCRLRRAELTLAEIMPPQPKASSVLKFERAA